MSFLCKDQKDSEVIADISALTGGVIKCNRANTFICLIKLKKTKQLEKILKSENIFFPLKKISVPSSRQLGHGSCCALNCHQLPVAWKM